ncbi:serine/threonine-protein kinase [Agrococcus sp. SGAir0287]|uniref:serine/threonine-protein kinase n=1 Tax=Agrococcus sp. SGAir0287 TaxID=2070347 RepID=UPI0010CCFA82|nr:serine/threonine-protein kinase [Agrococcus sp. SGAir0287]QCR20104.1 serine/threonine protein kinase [Agrococcus sp. SGAir0287]
MSPRRAPSPPPVLPGYEHRRLLGTGGFADVFLYEQVLPSRPVAVKVLLTETTDRDVIEHFRQEANVMAQLSSHPSIVTIYGAAVSDDGRPYLVMEYCPRPNLGVRYRSDRFSVAEVLALGVQIAGAVETAHRAGVLHRDIKPANILVTAYNRPALTDFGIATTTGEADASTGMSIPWSPPEAFAERPWSGRESDVFALGATLYTLLAGRSPFELPGGSNTSLDVIARIERGEIAPLARSDVPASLEAVLRSSMEVDPRRRYASAQALGRALQQVEAEMSLSVTQMDVLDDSLPVDVVDDQDGGATRIRGVVEIDPHVDDPPRLATSSPAPAMPSYAAAAQVVSDATIVRPSAAQASAPAIPRPGELPVAPESGSPWAVASEQAQAERRKRSRTPIVAAIAGAVVLVVAATGVWLVVTSGAGTSQPGPSTTIAAPEPGAPSPPIAFQTTVEADGVRFGWTNPSPADGDAYVVRSDPSAGTPVRETIVQPEIVVPIDPDGQTCIAVAIQRATGMQSDYEEHCVDA